MQSWGEVFEGDDIVLRYKEDLFIHDCCDESIPFFLLMTTVHGVNVPKMYMNFKGGIHALCLMSNDSMYCTAVIVILQNYLTGGMISVSYSALRVFFNWVLYSYWERAQSTEKYTNVTFRNWAWKQALWWHNCIDAAHSYAPYTSAGETIQMIWFLWVYLKPVFSLDYSKNSQPVARGSEPPLLWLAYWTVVVTAAEGVMGEHWDCFWFLKPQIYHLKDANVSK